MDSSRHEGGISLQVAGRQRTANFPNEWPRLDAIRQVGGCTGDADSHNEFFELQLCPDVQTIAADPIRHPD
jgi:hypothetical protein